jgi:hypothetical protein
VVPDLLMFSVEGTLSAGISIKGKHIGQVFPKLAHARDAAVACTLV